MCEGVTVNILNKFVVFFFLVSQLSVPVPWGEIRGKVWGPDHGRPVLCLHGWADNCGSFNTVIPLLPKGELEHFKGL